jgi:PAS domain-containing protein
LLLVWSLGYIMELSADRLSDKLFWADIQYLGATPLPLVWYLTVRRAVGRRRLPTWLVRALWAACGALLAVVFVNPAGLFRGEPSLDPSGPTSLVDPDYGILYYLALVSYAFPLLLAAVVTLVRATAHTLRVFRDRNLILLAATLLPLTGGAMYTAGLVPWRNYNPAMASVAVSAVLCGYALWRYRLFDVAPLARDAVIDHLPDGLLVCDLEGRLVDYNPAARAVLPELGPHAVGEPLAHVCARRPELAEAVARRLNGDAPSPSDVEAPGYGRFSITEVTSRAGRLVGLAVVLRDGEAPAKARSGGG